MVKKRSRVTGLHSRESLMPLEKIAVEPMVTSRLIMVDPTTVPMPISSVISLERVGVVWNRARIEIKSSGEDVPAAMKIAPATSSGILKTLQISISDSFKYFSQTTINPTKM